MNCEIFVGKRSAYKKHPEETLNIEGYVYLGKDVLQMKKYN